MRNRQVCLTQRVDLPPEPVAPDHLFESVDVVVAACRADSAVVAVYGLGDGRATGWREDVHVAVTGAMARADVPLLDSLHVEGDRWWSYGCDEPCCPAEGRLVQPGVRAQVAELFADAGPEPAASREEIVESMGSLSETVAQVEPLVRMRAQELAARLEASANPAAAKEQWRDECLARLIPIFAARADGAAEPAADPEPAAIAEVLLALADIRVRDTLLWHLAAASDGSNCLHYLTAALRAAPTGLVAPVASCAAICAWLLGDGVRANAALDRAVADDPRYSLAWLVTQSISHGLPPSTWRQVMSRLTEVECRYGPSAADEQSDADPGSQSDAASEPDAGGPTR
jgi:hypothetical protein